MAANQDMPALLALLAVCVARCGHAGGADWTEGRGTGSVAAQVAQAAGLDMRTWWQPTPESYLGRVPKALILEAVRDGAGEPAASRIAGMKKEAMVANAAELLDGTGWLAEILRMPPRQRRRRCGWQPNKRISTNLLEGCLGRPSFRLSLGCNLPGAQPCGLIRPPAFDPLLI